MRAAQLGARATGMQTLLSTRPVLAPTALVRRCVQVRAQGASAMPGDNKPVVPVLSSVSQLFNVFHDPRCNQRVSAGEQCT